jgi:hypothetical protein
MRSPPERTELRAQGAISLSSRGSWRLGWLTLGDTALTFQSSGRRGAFRIELGSVTRLGLERRTFVVVGKRVVRLTYRTPGAACPHSCWLITAQLADWEAALSRRLGCARGDVPAVAPARPVAPRLAAALADLTGPPALILDYLAHRGHATTAELVALTGADTEESLLLHLNEGYRQVELALGGPAVRYEGSFFDRRSGTVRQQAWRACETVAEGWLASRVPTDVLVEDDELLVVTSVPTQVRGVLPSALVAPDGRGFMVRGTGGHDRWIGLPEEVTGEVRCAIGATGTLVIRGRRKGNHGGDLTS